MWDPDWFKSPELSPALKTNSIPNHLINTPLCFCLFDGLVFEIGSCKVAQTGFELMAISLPQYPECWDNRNEHPAGLKLCQDWPLPTSSPLLDSHCFPCSPALITLAPFISPTKCSGADTFLLFWLPDGAGALQMSGVVDGVTHGLVAWIQD